MRTQRDRSFSTHHHNDNDGRQPLYFRPRFLPGPNVRRHSVAARLTIFLCVVFILALWLAYRVWTAPVRPQEPPSVPTILFRLDESKAVILDPRNSA